MRQCFKDFLDDGGFRYSQQTLTCETKTSILDPLVRYVKWDVGLNKMVESCLGL